MALLIIEDSITHGHSAPELLVLRVSYGKFRWSNSRAIYSAGQHIREVGKHLIRHSGLTAEREQPQKSQGPFGPASVSLQSFRKHPARIRQMEEAKAQAKYQESLLHRLEKGKQKIERIKTHPSSHQI